MSKTIRLGMFVLLSLAAATVGAADVTVRQFRSEVQPVLSPQLSAWVAAQSSAATRSVAPVDAATIRKSAAAVLGAGKATAQNVEVLLSLVMAAVLQDAEQDIRQIVAEIETDAALKKKIHEAMTLLREGESASLAGILDARPTLMSERQKQYDEARKALEDAMRSGGVNSEQVYKLKQVLMRFSQAIQQLSAMLAAYSQNAFAIIRNIA